MGTRAYLDSFWHMGRLPAFSDVYTSRACSVRRAVLWWSSRSCSIGQCELTVAAENPHIAYGWQLQCRQHVLLCVLCVFSPAAARPSPSPERPVASGSSRFTPLKRAHSRRAIHSTDCAGGGWR